jgi:exosome complex component RRP45
MLRRDVQSTNERKFIETAVQAGLRVDGRSPGDMRDVDIRLAESTGHAEVLLGQTRVLASVTADLVQPRPDRPAEGFLSFHVDFSPMASPYFETGRPSDKAIELERVIERGIRDSHALDTEALCVLAGQKVWAVRVDIHVLDDGGNLVSRIRLDIQ